MISLNNNKETVLIINSWRQVERAHWRENGCNVIKIKSLNLMTKSTDVIFYWNMRNGQVVFSITTTQTKQIQQLTERRPHFQIKIKLVTQIFVELHAGWVFHKCHRILSIVQPWSSTVKIYEQFVLYVKGQPHSNTIHYNYVLDL